jgi:deoxyribodipyrimidine photo-lyase
MEESKRSVFIFRRDYRVEDNLGFIQCYKESEKILPIFIFTTEQANKKENEYFSDNCFQFLVESLYSLEKEIKIHYFYGDNISILKKIKKNFDFNAIYFNKDYTPYAKRRDKEILDYCEEEEIECVTVEDYLLFPMGTIVKKDGLFYQKFTPFKNVGIKLTPAKPTSISIQSKKFAKKKFDFEVDHDKINSLYTPNPHLHSHGGRPIALNILKNMAKWNQYKEMRNDLSYATTYLSAYIKFGCVSIREVYWSVREKIGMNTGLIEQLFWREFYFYLIDWKPEILEKGYPQHMKFSKIHWKNNPGWFEKWKEGKTGYPVVDAGIREMNETGYMHNRARLIVASVLIKILQIDWRWGEKYFATKLIDYDPSVNNGNWQWCAGTGENPQDYWRFFSPWKQAMDYDPNCEYIKKWVPELKDLPCNVILKWNEKYEEWKEKTDYPKPIAEFNAELRENVLEMYRDSFQDYKE